MSVPKKKHTKSAVGRGRAHLALKKLSLKDCPKCGRAVKPHHACAFCGNYRDREALAIKTKKTKNTKKENE
jgi:large subunit ribosomal protein L32